MELSFAASIAILDLRQSRKPTRLRLIGPSSGVTSFVNNNNIRLLDGGGRSPYGFYSTVEGRKFLRFCYGRYIALRRKPDDGTRLTAHGKAAMSVADNEEQVRSTARALKRWCDDTQADIWTNDTTKSINIAKKIEVLISSEKQIADLLNDRASNIRINDIANGFSTFFFTASQPYLQAVGKQSISRYSGLFTVWIYSGDGDRYRDYYYASDVHVLLAPHDTLPIMILQEFSIRQVGTDWLIFDRRSGFALYGDNGLAIHYLINYSKPEERWVEVYTLDEAKTDCPGLTEVDRRYYIKDVALSKLGEKGVASKRASMADVIRPQDPRHILLYRAAEDVQEIANKLIIESKWDIII